MFARKQLVTTITVIATCVITTTFGQTNFNCNGDWSCKSPTGEDGYCIPHKFCKPINNLLTELRESKELTQDVAKFLQKFICGYSDDQARVCCPFSPIVLPKQRIDTSRVDVSSHRNINLLPKDCGIINDANRVFGGNATNLFQFPWMALLSYDLGGGIGYRCGGTIINERYILTAAHCLTGLIGIKVIGVRVGEYDIRTLRDCQKLDLGVEQCSPPVQDRAFAEIIAHPDYNGRFEHDIGLIRLASPIDLSQENAKPICLPTEMSLRNADLSSQNLTVTGWGLLSLREQSPVLLQANIPLVPEDICRKGYANNKNIEITSNHICAGSKTADACSGDSGGPLQKVDMFDNDLRYIQYGIVSFGPKFCGNTAAPGVYTKIDSYLQWILDNMKP